MNFDSIRWPSRALAYQVSEAFADDGDVDGVDLSHFGQEHSRGYLDGMDRLWPESVNRRRLSTLSLDRCRRNHRAFIWNADNGIPDLKQALLELGIGEVSDWILSEATDISAEGQTIVGVGVNPTGRPQAWAVRLPCPASLRLDLHPCQRCLSV